MNLDELDVEAGSLPPPESSGPADGELLRRALGGEEVAFQELHRRHAARVRGACARLAGRREAEDLAQDTWTRIWSHLGDCRAEGPYSFASWALSVARSTAANWRRGSAPRSIEKTGVCLERAAGGGEDRRLRQLPERLALRSALRQLPRKSRQVLLLHALAGLQHAEIAAQLRCSEGNSRIQLTRACALARLRYAAGEEFAERSREISPHSSPA